jgi:hypothetical protein
MHFLGLVSALALAAFASAAPHAQTGPVTIMDKAFDTCSGWSNNGAVVSANCANGNGGNSQSELYLGNCFVNNGGVLSVSLSCYRVSQGLQLLDWPVRMITSHRPTLTV